MKKFYLMVLLVNTYPIFICANSDSEASDADISETEGEAPQSGQSFFKRFYSKVFGSDETDEVVVKVEDAPVKDDTEAEEVEEALPDEPLVWPEAPSVPKRKLNPDLQPLEFLHEWKEQSNSKSKKFFERYATDSESFKSEEALREAGINTSSREGNDTQKITNDMRTALGNKIQYRAYSVTKLSAQRATQSRDDVHMGALVSVEDNTCTFGEAIDHYDCTPGGEYIAAVTHDSCAMIDTTTDRVQTIEHGLENPTVTISADGSRMIVASAASALTRLFKVAGSGASDTMLQYIGSQEIGDPEPHASTKLTCSNDGTCYAAAGLLYLSTHTSNSYQVFNLKKIFKELQVADVPTIEAIRMLDDGSNCLVLSGQYALMLDIEHGVPRKPIIDLGASHTAHILGELGVMAVGDKSGGYTMLHSGTPTPQRYQSNIKSPIVAQDMCCWSKILATASASGHIQMLKAEGGAPIAQGLVKEHVQGVRISTDQHERDVVAVLTQQGKLIVLKPSNTQLAPYEHPTMGRGADHEVSGVVKKLLNRDFGVQISDGTQLRYETVPLNECVPVHSGGELLPPGPLVIAGFGLCERPTKKIIRDVIQSCRGLADFLTQGEVVTMCKDGSKVVIRFKNGKLVLVDTDRKLYAELAENGHETQVSINSEGTGILMLNPSADTSTLYWLEQEQQGDIKMQTGDSWTLPIGGTAPAKFTLGADAGSYAWTTDTHIVLVQENEARLVARDEYSEIQELSVSHDGTECTLVSQDEVVVLDMLTGEEKRKIQLPFEPTAILFGDDDAVVLGGADGSVLFVDAEGDAHAVEKSTGKICALARCHYSKLIALASSKGEQSYVRFVDTVNNKIIAEQEFEGGILDICISTGTNDHNVIAVLRNNGLVRLLEVDKEQQSSRLLKDVDHNAKTNADITYGSVVKRYDRSVGVVIRCGDGSVDEYIIPMGKLVPATKPKAPPVPKKPAIILKAIAPVPPVDTSSIVLEENTKHKKKKGCCF